MSWADRAAIGWWLFALVIVAWLLGLLAGFGGSLINLLLVVGVVIVLVQYLRESDRT